MREVTTGTKKSDYIENIVENGIEINDPKLVAEKFKESKA